MGNNSHRRVEKRQRNLSALSMANYITRAFRQDFFLGFLRCQKGTIYGWYKQNGSKFVKIMT